MSIIENKSQFMARRFAVVVRQVLNEIGHSDIRFEARWLHTEFDNDKIVFIVPINTQFSVPLIVSEKPEHEWHDCQRKEFAGYVAHALVNLSKASKRLTKYQRQLTISAIANIQKARDKGLELQFEKMAFNPITASHISGCSWQEAEANVIGVMFVSHTNDTLRPSISPYRVNDDRDIGRALEALCEKQGELEKISADLDAMNADLIVDTITLDIMRAEGLEPVEVLRELLASEKGTLTFRNDERSVLAISMDQGRASVLLITSNAVWNGKVLWLTDESGMAIMTAGNSSFDDLAIGKTLASHVDYPAFTSRPISGVGRSGYYIDFELDGANLFDAYTGTFRLRNELAA